jgi:hypothetical protein
MRAAVTVEGLAVAGPASIGGLTFRCPTLAWSQRATEAPPGDDPKWPITLSEGPAGPLGSRSLELRGTGQRLELVSSVLAPEVSGVAGGAQAVAADVWLVHWPIQEAEWATLRAARPAMVVLGNARVLFAEGEPLVLAIRDIRERLGAAPLLWAPRVALPHRLAFLTYLGCDLLDTTEARLRAQRGVLLDETLGELEPEAAAGRCDCPFCTGADPGPERHVRWVFEREGALVAASLRSHHLRELVEVMAS